MNKRLKKQWITAGLTTAVAMVLTCITACKSDAQRDQLQAVTPSDFVTQGNDTSAVAQLNPQAETDATTPAAPATTPAATTPAAAQNHAPADVATSNSSSATNGDSDQPTTFALDAMVGQVNGRAIYANTVFDPINAQLAALGRTLPPSIFRQRASELIVGQLQTMVTNALILGEAERDLSVQERHGLLAMLQARREDLLRQFGEGSSAVADDVSLQRTGKNIDEQVKDFRERVLVGRYISQQVRNKVNVSRKDIERYYDSHKAKYNPPAGRTIRLIMTSSKADADQLQKLLASGTPFDDVAKSSANQYRASQGGLMADRIEGNKFSGFDALNKAMVKLKAGEHSPRIEAGGSYWWVKVETYDAGKGRSLEQVQLEIRQLLEDQQRNALGLEFRQKLLAQGSYNPINEMASKLIEIAMARYAKEQS